MAGITARVQWNVRTPSVSKLEGVLTEMSDDGWMVYKISEPMKGINEPYVMVVFHKAEIVKGPAAVKLIEARTA